jgi:hypothetical protein
MCYTSRIRAENERAASGFVACLSLLLLIPGIALVAIFPSDYSIKETLLVNSVCVVGTPCLRTGSSAMFYTGFIPEYNTTISTGCQAHWDNMLAIEPTCSSGHRMYYFKHKLPTSTLPDFVSEPVVNLYIVGWVFLGVASICWLIYFIMICVHIRLVKKAQLAIRTRVLELEQTRLQHYV